MSTHAKNITGLAVEAMREVPWFAEAFNRLDRTERTDIRAEMTRLFSNYLNDHVYEK